MVNVQFQSDIAIIKIGKEALNRKTNLADENIYEEVERKMIIDVINDMLDKLNSEPASEESKNQLLSDILSEYSFEVKSKFYL